MPRPFAMNIRIPGALILAMLGAGSCTSASHNTPKAAKTLVVGSAPSSESVIGAPPSSESLIMAHLYAGVLRADGYQVILRTGLSQRRSTLAALHAGGRENGIDLFPSTLAPCWSSSTPTPARPAAT